MLRRKLFTILILFMCLTLWQIALNSNSVKIESLSPADYNQLIDLKNFTFNILNYLCNDTSPLLIVMVHSSPSHFKYRTAIRLTWGRPNPQSKLLFLLGLVGNNTKLQQQINIENEHFGDLIQGSFFDDYRNMTYKHMMLFKYVIYHCPHAKYVLKTDDDAFVNTPLLLKFLAEDKAPFGGEGKIFCNLEKNAVVRRSNSSKWRVSMKEYAARTYPPYCLGWIILYSGDIVFNLYISGQRTEYFWVDDVHVTGMLARQNHLNHVNIEKLVLNYTDFVYKTYHHTSFNKTFLFSPPDVSIRDIIELWNYVEAHHAVSIYEILVKNS